MFGGVVCGGVCCVDVRGVSCGDCCGGFGEDAEGFGVASEVDVGGEEGGGEWRPDGVERGFVKDEDLSRVAR